MADTSLDPMSGHGTDKTIRVLGFEGWDSGSHRAVRESIVRHGALDWQWITLPPANWRWRLRLGAVDLVEAGHAEGALVEAWNAIFVTSLVSLSDLVALLPASLAAVPRILYMHENQAAYPAAAGRDDQRDAHAIATNLTSMLAADRIIWNSQWNHDSFITGAASMLRTAKGAVAGDMLRRVTERSQVIWPPVETPINDDDGVLHKASEAHDKGWRLVVWPHRWEHDKGPEALLTIERAQGERDRIGWILLGQQFDQQPAALAALRESAGERVLHAGHAVRSQYEAWLRAADWVCSTARHEFFGIAVVEALLAGCLPWLPERLSYPELLPRDCIGLSPATFRGDRAAMQAAIRQHLQPATATEAVMSLESAVTATSPLFCR